MRRLTLSKLRSTIFIAGLRCLLPSLQCADPAAYDADSGVLLMSVCWTSKDLPASLLSASSSTPMLRVTLPRVAKYGVSSMAPGSYSVTVSGSASSAGLTVHPATASAADIQAGPFALPQSASTGVAGSSVDLPVGGASAITMWFDVPLSAAATAPASSNGNSAGASGKKTVYTVTLRLSGPPNPPPAASVCKCPTAADAVTGACPSGLATLTASSLTSSTSTANTAAPAAPVQCVPPPQYLPTSRRLIFSTCWRYGCLPSTFARLPYEFVITPPYDSSTAGGALAAGLYSLRATLPGASVGMALELLPAAGVAGPSGSSSSSNETAVAQWLSYGASSGQGGPTTVVVPPGGVSQLRVRVRVPFDLDLDNESGTAAVLPLLEFDWAVPGNMHELGGMGRGVCNACRVATKLHVMRAVIRLTEAVAPRACHLYCSRGAGYGGWHHNRGWPLFALNLHLTSAQAPWSSSTSMRTTATAATVPSAPPRL